MPQPTPLSQALHDLAELIDTCAVQQGQYHIVRGSAIQELERRARRVLETMAAAQLGPGPAGQLEPRSPVHQAHQEAARLERGAKDASSCGVDVRLGASPAALHELFERAARETGGKSAKPKQRAADEQGAKRRARPERTPPGRGSVRPPRAVRRVPKHLEMMGKAAKLSELIQRELQDNVGRTITEMCQTVGVSRETFQNSKHFRAARLAWGNLRDTRRSQ
jgi:hypothetical protein